MSQNGKGDKRRPSKPGSYERGYESIDWSKGRKSAAPGKVSVNEVLATDYNAVLPACGCGGLSTCTNPPGIEHSCPCVPVAPIAHMSVR